MSYGVYAYKTVKVVQPSHRAQRVKNTLFVGQSIQIIADLCIIIISLSMAFLLGEYLLLDLSLMFTDQILAPFINIHYLITGITTLLTAIVFSSLIILYPEALLISHVQLLRAKKLYNEIQSTSIEHLKEDQLTKYLQSIPSTVFEGELD